MSKKGKDTKEISLSLNKSRLEDLKRETERLHYSKVQDTIRHIFAIYFQKD